MTVYGRLIGNSFDILDIEETDASLVRKKDEVRLTFKEDGKLVKYVKLSEKQPAAGDHLVVTHHGVLLPTGDRNSKRAVAKLLSNISNSTVTKTIVHNNISYTAHLLPVQLL